MKQEITNNKAKILKQLKNIAIINYYNLNKVYLSF